MTSKRASSKPPARAGAAADLLPDLRVLAPREYPRDLLAQRGAYASDIRFVAQHPRGTYHVEHEGAGHFGAYFTPRRAGARPRLIGGARSLGDALRLVLDHEAELQGAAEADQVGDLGERKDKTQLAREIKAWLATAPRVKIDDLLS